jgi:signal transduction histidine kinase
LQIFLFLPLSWKIIIALILLAFSTLFVSLVYGMNNSIYLFLGIMFVVILTAFFVSSSIQKNYVQHNLIKELEETRQALARVERQAGVVEERQRLAYEIHDTLAQGFSSIVMHLEAAEAKWQGEATVVSEHIDRARRIARENASEARRLIWALQSEALGRASLGEVLSTLAARWSSENEIASSAAVTGDIYPLRPEYEHILLRAAQEALTNVRKHAQASRITMTLSYMDQVVTLDIEDNGTGFELGAREDLVDLVGAQSSGFGLKSLGVRIEKLGGTLTIESAPGEGTILAVALPTPSQENQEQIL